MQESWKLLEADISQLPTLISCHCQAPPAHQGEYRPPPIGIQAGQTLFQSPYPDETKAVWW